VPAPLLPWAARSLAYELGLPHAEGGSTDYRTQYSNRNHRNKCVFEGANPDMVESLTLLDEERCLWMMAGAHGLSHLTAPLPGG
jgi:hypothetical protein